MSVLHGSGRRTLVTPLAVVVLLNCIDDLDDLAFALLGPEIQAALGLSPGLFVALSTLPVAAVGLLVWPVSVLADRSVRVRLTQAAAVVWSTATLVVATAVAAPVLVLARLASALAKTMNEPVQVGLLADWYPPQRHGRVFGIHQSANWVAGLLVAVVGAVAAAAGWRAAVAVVSVPAAAAALLSLRLREPDRRSPLHALGLTPSDVDEGPVPLRPALARLWALPSLRADWLSGLLAGAAVLPFPAVLSFLFEQRFGLGPGARGGVFAAFGCGAVIGVLVAGRLGERAVTAGSFGRVPRLAGLGQAGAAAAALGLAATGDLRTAVVLTAAIGLLGPALGVYQSLLVTLVAPPRLRAQAGAGWFAAWSLGGLLSGGLVGGLLDAAGPGPALAAVAALLVGCAALLMVAGARLPRDVATTAAEAPHRSAVATTAGAR